MLKTETNPVILVDKTGCVINVLNGVYITDNPLGAMPAPRSSILSFVDGEKDKTKLQSAIESVAEGKTFMEKVYCQMKNKGGKPVLLRFKVLSYDYDKVTLLVESEKDECTGDVDRGVYESFLDNIPMPIAIRNVTRKLQYVYFNKKAEELFGVKRDQVIGKSDNVFMDSESGAQLDSYTRNAGNGDGAELRLKAKRVDGGKDLDLSVQQSRLSSEDTHIITYSFTDRSLPDGVLMKNNLLLEQCRMSMKMARMEYWIWSITDRCFTLLSENKNYPDDVKMGYGEDALLKLIKAEDCPRMIAVMDNVRAKNLDTVSIEFEYYQKSEQRYVWMVAYGKVAKYSEDGKPVSMVGVTFNNSMMKDLEKKAKKADSVLQLSNTSKSNLLNNINLVVNAPLNSILGYAQLIEEEKDNDTRSQYVKALQNDSADLLNKINLMIQIANVESGSATFIRQPVDLNGLIVEMSGLAKSQNKKEQVTIETNIPRMSVTLMLDSRYLIKVMSVLVTNALHFTVEGTITLGYNIYPDKSVYVYVQDTGCGIPQDKIKYIFDRFNAQDMHRNPSSGLGLLLCKAIVERMGGEIGVDSVEGKGSKFWFTVNTGY